MDLSYLAAVWLAALQVFMSTEHCADATAEQITAANFDEYLRTKDVILMNFYADWCRFSQALKPAYDKAAELLHFEEAGRVTLGKVNCDAEKSFCSDRFHITKYPTVKIVRYGQIARKEYRGQRSTDALVDYVRKQLTDPIQIIDYEKMHGLEGKSMVGFFHSTSDREYDTFKKVAINLRDDCPFYAVVGDEGAELAPRIIFTEDESDEREFAGDFGNMYGMFSWVYEQCVPMVREITFGNGEEMTEEGLPLLILFYHPDRPETKEHFRQRVMEELADQKGSINCVTANGDTFAHPLHHLGKGKKDLPLIAIDSFRHMFLFPEYGDIDVPGKLMQFVTDHHSGKLHREFHHGPDPTEQKTQQVDSGSKDRRSADPPESTFKKLSPSGSRYSLLGHHDEL